MPRFLCTRQTRGAFLEFSIMRKLCLLVWKRSLFGNALLVSGETKVYPSSQENEKKIHTELEM